MGRYLIKTQMRVFEAENSAQLARLAVLGLVSRDALIRDAEDGRWTRAEDHPDIGRLYRSQEDTERTVIAALVPELQLPQAQPQEQESVLWVRTDVSTVEVRGFGVLTRLFDLGVVRAGHQVGSSPVGPFVQLEGRPEKRALAARLGMDEVVPAAPPAPSASTAEMFARLIPKPSSPSDDPYGVTTILRGHSGRVLEAAPEQRKAESSVVVMLRDMESPHAEAREVSNVVMLSAADIEIVEDSDAHIEEEVILLSAEDIEEFESINEARPVPHFDSPWEAFRKAINAAASRTIPQETSQESTWDLFRGMMRRRRDDGRSGPSEESWKRFKLRLGKRPAAQASPARPESTWDRFRQIMASSASVPDSTWDRFVHTIQKRSIALATPLKGEAIIKSGVVHVADLEQPSVEVFGLGDD
ncbi:MAG: hypothetical protein RBU37_09015 [Myxococcota bacterium]|nr:hypothetical protein [Myxococcota bacterium]